MGSTAERNHGRKCAYCKREMNRHDAKLIPTVDHVKPRSVGGRQKVICCIICNTIKGNMMPERWAAFMLANPTWWRMSWRDIRLAKMALPLDAAANLILPADEPRRYPRARLKKSHISVVVPPELIFKEEA